MQSRRTPRDTLSLVIAPAIEAVRTTLRRREARDVPHRLRRVAQASGPRLPRPLLTTLLEHLEEDEDLRLEALELLDGPDTAVAYLGRESGWWQVIAAAVEARALAQDAEAHAATERSLTVARSETAEAKRRLAAAQEDVQRVEAELADLRSAQAERVAAARRSDAEQIVELERRASAAEAQRDQFAATVDELRMDLDSLRRRTANRERPATDRRSERVTAGGIGEDPLRTARTLDLHHGIFQRRRWNRPTDDATQEARPVTLDPPPGLRSTDEAWLSWLGAQESPYWLIIDGHNVVFTMTEDRSRMTDEMRRLESGARRLLARSAARARITIVYDSDLDGDRDAAVSERGLVIRYAPLEAVADDVIADLVEAADLHEHAVVVVTSDRELQDRVALRATVVAGLALARHVTGS